MESQKCIWMEAGSIEYQLCPLKQNCDLCDFHKEMIRGYRRSAQMADVKTLNLLTPESSLVQFTPGLQFIHRHFWIKRTGKGKMRLGIDAFLWQFFSSVEKIITPKNYTPLFENQCFSWLQLVDDIIFLRSPLAGQILQSNPLFSSAQIQDSHLYMSPEEELWLVELAVDEGSLGLVYLRRDEYLKLIDEDIKRFMRIIENETKLPPQPGGRRSQVSKKAFSKYLMDISDSLAYAC
jgi:glycine cleavage system H lipoate-binding protein